MAVLCREEDARAAAAVGQLWGLMRHIMFKSYKSIHAHAFTTCITRSTVRTQVHVQVPGYMIYNDYLTARS